MNGNMANMASINISSHSQQIELQLHLELLQLALQSTVEKIIHDIDIHRGSVS